MERTTLVVELDEASGHLSDLLERIAKGDFAEEHSDAALAVDLGHVLDHLCRAWNHRNLPIEKYADMTQEEFEAASQLIPNFQGNRTLGRFA